MLNLKFIFLYLTYKYILLSITISNNNIKSKDKYGKYNLIITDFLSDCSLYRGRLSQYKSLPQQYTCDRRDSSDALLPPRGKSEYT